VNIQGATRRATNSIWNGVQADKDSVQKKFGILKIA